MRIQSSGRMACLLAGSFWLSTGAQAQVRQVPLRLVQTVSNCPGGACAPNLPLADRQLNLERVNAVFQDSTARFWVRSDERLELPAFDTNSATPVSWASVRDQLRQVFPTMPLNAYASNEMKSAPQFWNAAVACYGSRDEVVVRVRTGGGSAAQFPSGGHAVMVATDNLTEVHPAVGTFATHIFAHELGHHLGLGHSFEGSIAGATNPATGGQFQQADRWDLRFCDESDIGQSVPRFFDSRADFLNNPCSNPTALMTSNAANLSHFQGRPRLRIQTSQGNQYTYFATTAGVQGILKDFGGVHDPGLGQYRFGINVMEYYSRWGMGGQNALAPAFLSDSQVDVVDAFLTGAGNVDIVGANLTAIQRSDGNLPVGCGANATNGNRSALGTGQSDFIWWSNGDQSFASSELTMNTGYLPFSGDFDGDGNGDVLWYNPANGWANYTWSDGERSFTGQWVWYGTGYTIFVGDFDGQQGTDIYRYRPGGGADSILWSDGDRSFTTQNRSVSGTYVPFALDLDDQAGDDIVWYMPQTGKAHIWWSDGDRTFTHANSLNFGLVDYTPVVGDFDGADGEDIFWYRAGSGAANQDRITWSDGGRDPVGATENTTNVHGTYQPLSGDFDGDGRADIIWNAASTTDYLWMGTANGQFLRNGELSIPGDFNPAAGDFDGDGLTDVFWHRAP